MNFMSEIWPSFILHLRTDKSRKNYQAALNDLLTVTGKEDFLDVAAADVSNYRHTLGERIYNGKMTPKTISTRLYMLKSVAKYTYTHLPEDYFYKNPFINVYITADTNIAKDSIPVDSIISLMHHVESEDYELYTIILLTIYCTLTVSEICRLMPKDISTGDRTCISIESYYKRVIAVPDFIAARLNISNDHLFLNSRGRAIQPRYLQRALLIYTSEYTFQQLRTFGLIQMYKYGVDDNAFKRYTGIIKQYKRYRDAAELIESAGIDYSHCITI